MQSRPSLIAIAILALASLIPAGASADDGNSSPFTKRQSALANHWHGFWSICERARKSETLTSAEKLNVCTQVGEMMDEKFAEPDFAARDDIESNFFWTSRGGVHSMVQGIYADEDGVLSRRVCEAVMRAQAAEDKVKLDAWPKTPEGDQLRNSQKQAEQTGARNVERCRAEFGL